MSCINYIRLCKIQGREDLEPKDVTFVPYRRKKSEGTIQTERIEGRYVSRRNICPRCFVAVSNNGSCNC